jgi:EAL domain-containing protein (putative c-di-GMP-specific phosphodiesterase class I)
LQSSLRATDVVARLARDELAVVMPPTPRVEDPGRVAGKLLASLDGPLELNGSIVRPNPRVGVAIAPVDAVTPDGLIQRAHLARQAAGAAPEAAYRSYRDGLAPGGLNTVELIDELGAALAADDGQLWVAYQPKIDLQRETVAGFEALARWDHPRFGSISPAVFVRAAEQSDVIFDLGAWVFNKVCAQLAAWNANLNQLVPVSVNVSARQLERSGLADLVRDTLERHGVPADLLELELTEAILIDEGPELSAIIDRLSGLGLTIAIDDFSTGHSVLGHLRRFPIDVLKIDRAFIRDIDDPGPDGATSTEIIEMAHSLSLRVIAEGVETPEQLSVLRTLGCDAAQGYYFAHPSSAAEIDRRAAA